MAAPPRRIRTPGRGCFSLQSKRFFVTMNSWKRRNWKTSVSFFQRRAARSSLPAEKKWEEIFSGWIDKIDQEKMMLDLFELKLWLESIEEFNSSAYLENLIFKFQSQADRNYEFYVFSLNQVTGRITALLKELDFKKDKYFLNFEEFIVDKILEGNMEKTFPNLKELYSPESWFYSFRIFLQSFRTLLGEILRVDIRSRSGATWRSRNCTTASCSNNPILISLLKKQFIPRMDKIYQPDISGIISACKDKNIRKNLGIFFILSFRILKISNFIELNLNKNKYLDMTIPLILSLKKNMEAIIDFNESALWQNLQSDPGAEKGTGTGRRHFQEPQAGIQEDLRGRTALVF